MIGYTCIGTNDLEKAADFYDQLLSLLGAKPFFKNGSRGWMGGEPQSTHVQRDETFQR
jgi:hypothetical protein